MTVSRLTAFAVTALLMLAAPVHAANQPSPPEEVFRYVIFDAGDALEIDWAVDDGAYMYRSAFGFESGDSSVVFGDVEYPAGKIHSDEFLGEQEIYRGSFFVRIPYTVEGDKPASVPLTIESRGCLDSGFCYVPQTWIETVDLAGASHATDSTTDFDALFGSGGGNESEFPPPDEVFFPDILPIDGNTVEVIVRVEPGYYLYRHRFSVTSLSDNARVGNIEWPKGKMKTDEFFGEQEVYYDEVVGRVTIQRATPQAMDLELELGYQGCADAGLCYVPLTKTFTVNLAEATAITDLSTLPARSDNAAPVSEQARLANIITGSSIWVAAGVFSSPDWRWHSRPACCPWCPSYRASSPAKVTMSHRCAALRSRSPT